MTFNEALESYATPCQPGIVVTDGRPLSRQLASIRSQRGWSVVDAAREAGVPAYLWVEWERGSAPNETQLRRLCGGLGIRREWL